MKRIGRVLCLLAGLGVLLLLLSAAPPDRLVSDDLPALGLTAPAEAGPLAKVGKGLAAVGRAIVPGQRMPEPQFVPTPQFVPVPRFETVETPKRLGRWESRRQCGPGGCVTVPVWVEAPEAVVVVPPADTPAVEPQDAAYSPAYGHRRFFGRRR